MDEFSVVDGLGGNTRQALSWAVAGALILQSPFQARVRQSFPGGGHYDCLEIVDEEGRVRSSLNRNGPCAFYLGEQSFHIWREAAKSPALAAQIVAQADGIQGVAGQNEANAKLAQLCFAMAELISRALRQHPIVFNTFSESVEIPDAWKDDCSPNAESSWIEDIWTIQLDGDTHSLVNLHRGEKLSPKGSVSAFMGKQQFTPFYLFSYTSKSDRRPMSHFVSVCSQRRLTRLYGEWSPEFKPIEEEPELGIGLRLWQQEDPAFELPLETDASLKDLANLAVKIAGCDEFHRGSSDRKHPCNGVINEQLKIRERSEMHLPEPWFGGLRTARVLIVSSNPGLNTSEGPESELFPTETWSSSEIADFYVNRLTSRRGPYVTFGHPEEPNFLTRSKDGEYRSAMANPKSPQKTWVAMHNRVSEILGDGIAPSRDYAITELVHCKSSDAAGVRQAASFCADKWLSQVASLTPAPVFLVAGAHSRDHFIKKEWVSEEFGLLKGYKELSPRDRALRDIAVIEIGGRRRVAVMNFHNGAGAEQKLPKVYDAATLSWLRLVANGDQEIPQSTRHLRELISSLPL